MCVQSWRSSQSRSQSRSRKELTKALVWDILREVQYRQLRVRLLVPLVVLQVLRQHLHC
jgi:hypothetical protein